MLTTATLDKLHALNLMGMARAFQEQQGRADYQALTFEERLGLLVDREQQDRDNRRLERNLKAARLRSNACIENLDFHRSQGLERSLILSLGEAHWVSAHQGILIVGPTGVGKTYTACALAQAAIRRGHTALYLRAPRMLDELSVARVDGRLPRLLAAWARVSVLLIDLCRPRNYADKVGDRCETEGFHVGIITGPPGRRVPRRAADTNPSVGKPTFHSAA